MTDSSTDTSHTLSNSTTVLVIGAHSRLGLGICTRFLQDVHESKDVTMIVTSTTLRGTQQAIAYIEKSLAKSKRSGSVEFDYLVMDFSRMTSVADGIRDLAKNYTHLDCVFVNVAANVDYYIGFGKLVKQTLSDPETAVRYPVFRSQSVGELSSDGMGLLFQCNVFAPYYFSRHIRSMLQDGGRLIWISYAMSELEYVSFDDLQLLHSSMPLEGSKRLLDLMHFGTYESLAKLGIAQYLVHPGVFVKYSSRHLLGPFFYYLTVILYYFVRSLGSPYHVVSGYTAANAPVYCALNGGRQDSKIGSSSWEAYRTDTEVYSVGSTEVVEYLDSLYCKWDDKLKQK